MQRFSIVLLISAALFATSGCASRKYVRNEVKTTGDALTARIEANEGETREVRDGVDRVGQRVTGVEGKVSDLDSGMNSLKGEVRTVDEKAGKAQSTADRAAGDVVILDQRFQNRNQFVIADVKSVQFKFDSAKLDQSYQAVLDEIAISVMQNPDAIVVLEGRTDSRGDQEYNFKLGERRIDAVRRYLAVEKGVPVYKIHEISLGAAKPIAENKTRDGREKNRAVRMAILVPLTEGSVAQRDN